MPDTLLRTELQKRPQKSEEEAQTVAMYSLWSKEPFHELKERRTRKTSVFLLVR